MKKGLKISFIILSVILFGSLFATDFVHATDYSGPFDQSLNTTDVVRFANFNAVGENTSVGLYANSGSTGDYVTGIGYAAGSGSPGNWSTYVGYYAGSQNSQSAVTAIGHQAASSNTGYGVDAIGYFAAQLNSGSYSTFLGSGAGQDNEGDYILGIGGGAASYNKGDHLVAIGSLAGAQNKGNYSFGLGDRTLYMSTGNNIIAIGTEAGYTSSGSNIIGIGYQAGMNSGDNVVAIGYQAVSSVANQFIVRQGNVNSIPLILGNFSSGNVGIGIPIGGNPGSKLYVEGNINATGDICTGSGKCLNSISGGAGMDYTNLALTNKSNSFGIFNITAGTFFGNLAWSYLTGIPSYVMDYMPYINLLNSSLQGKLDINDQRYNETALIAGKLDITDQRYNETALIGGKLDATDQRYNETGLVQNTDLRVDSLNATKLDATDQRYNETALISGKLDVSDQRYNETALALNVNSTTNARIDATAVSFTTADVTTTSNTAFSDSGISFNLLTNTDYSLVCDLIHNSSAATTGLAINLSSTASATGVSVSYDTWSSATAKVGFSAITFGRALVGTGSGAAVIYHSTIVAGFRTTSTGTLNLGIRSEVSGSRVRLRAGTRCTLYRQ